MKEAIKTFIKGMNTDLDNSMLGQGMYRYAKNLRLGNYDASSTNNIGALENVIGNTVITANPLFEGTILGQTNIRDYIVLFVKHSTYDAIYSLKLDSEGTAISEFNTVYTDQTSTAKLNFALDSEITSIGRQETENILKVYWADGINSIRYIDIIKNNTGTEVSSLEIVPPYIMGHPYAAKVIDGGNYKSGVLQYSYQLYNKNGTSTTFSPISNLIKLSAISEIEEGGSERGEDTDKSVEVNLNYEFHDTRFERIRIIAVYYTDIASIPHIRVIREMPNTSNITIIDTGNYIHELTLEEYTSFAETDYIPKSLESKNNHLFASNILEKDFDNEVLDTWDARAYRFSSKEQIVTYENYISGSESIPTEETITLDDLIIVTDTEVVFTEHVVFRTAPITDITPESTWEDFWFYRSGTANSDPFIYIVVPADFSVQTTAFITDPAPIRTEYIQNIYNYNFTTELLSFSGREIKGYKEISVDSDFYYPPDPDNTTSYSRVARLLNVNEFPKYISIVDMDEDPLHWNVPIRHDAINSYNKLDPSTNEQYKFQYNGSILGGEGPNIRYWFETVADFGGGIENNHQEPTKIGIRKQEGLYHNIACQPSEVYRVAIGFYNNKGQVSFVKWIGDIKTPEFLSNILNTPMTPSDTTRGFSAVNGANTSELRSYGLEIHFKLNNFPKDDSIQGWQIFRVERKESDRSVLYSGIISPVAYNTAAQTSFGGGNVYRPHSKMLSGNEYYPMLPLDATVSSTHYRGFIVGSEEDKIVEFISPEINFFKPEVEISNLKLRLDKIIHRTNSYYKDTNIGNTSVSFTKFGNSEMLHTDYTLPTTISQIYYNIDEYKYVTPVHENSTRAITINSNRYINQIYFTDDGEDNFGGRGSGIILGLSEGVYEKLRLNTVGYDTLTEHYAYGSLVRDVFYSRYGGSSYYDRLNNEYIPFSIYESIKKDSTYSKFGDIYITMFQFIRGLWWDTVSDGMQSMQESIAFPVESSIDLRYRLDNLQKYMNDGSSWVVDGLILQTMTPQETVEKGIELQPETYDPEIGDLYRYNSVYSVGPRVKKYFPKPFDFDIEARNDVKVIVSEKKINGEYEDSWTIFKPANFIEVDTAYGSVNALRSFRDKLWFWQDKAFGVLAVNERSLIQDNNPGQLSLGTGGVLQRYDYLTTSIGCKSNDSVGVSDAAIYWYDKINHQLLEYSERLTYLDIEKGIRSYLLDKLPSDKVIVEVDSKNREVIFAFPNSNVFVYNQANKVFTSEYSYIPYKIFKDFNENLITIPNNNKYSLYVHMDGNRGEFYGVKDNSEITVLVNEDYSATKVFDNIEFSSRVLQNSVDIFDDTFDNLKAYNSYQNTGEYDLIKDGVYSTTVLPLTRRERMWNTFMPRNAVSIDVSSNPDIQSVLSIDKNRQFKERMRDNYLILNMKYNNISGNKFYIPYVKIYYRYSIR